MTCTRCGASIPLDYCGVCQSILCPECMSRGCCGHNPAISGLAADAEEQAAGLELPVVKLRKDY